VIRFYALVEGRGDGSEEFYNLLQKILETTNKSYRIFVMGDLNARMNYKIAKCIGKHGETCNKNVERFLEFVVYNQFNIMNTWFERKGT
jgi:hypothetical protein